MLIDTLEETLAFSQLMISRSDYVAFLLSKWLSPAFWDSIGTFGPVLRFTFNFHCTSLLLRSLNGPHLARLLLPDRWYCKPLILSPELAIRVLSARIAHRYSQDGVLFTSRVKFIAVHVLKRHVER